MLSHMGRFSTFLSGTVENFPGNPEICGSFPQYMGFPTEKKERCNQHRSFFYFFVFFWSFVLLPFSSTT